MRQADRRHKVLTSSRTHLLPPLDLVHHRPPDAHAPRVDDRSRARSANGLRKILQGGKRRDADITMIRDAARSTWCRRRLPSNGLSCGAWRPHQEAHKMLIRPFLCDSRVASLSPAGLLRAERCAGVLECKSSTAPSAQYYDPSQSGACFLICIRRVR